MWNFIKGVEPPAKKIKQTDSQSKEKAKEYEKERRERKWKEAWKFDDNHVEREWLHYDEGKNEMSCMFCKQYATKDAQRSGPFVVGNQNFKLETIKQHEASQGHQHCVRIAFAKKSPASTPAEVALATLYASQTERLGRLFRNAHAIAKAGRPFLDFEWMCM